MQRHDKHWWFLAPVIFALTLWVVLIIRWWPLAMHVARGTPGMIAVVWGDLLLGWKCLLRAGAAFVPTLALWALLPPIRGFEVLVVVAVAVVIEVIAELGTSVLFGVHAALPIQLAATALGYGATTLGVVLLLRSRPKDDAAF